jgi:CBS domain containing-hemolysin-like protein
MQSDQQPLLSDMQKHVIQGAIKWSKQKVQDCKKDIEQVTSVIYDEVVDEAFIKRVKDSGYSRIPVFYDETKKVMIGCLLVKTLAGVDVDLKYTVRKMLEEKMCVVRKLLIVEPTANLENIISLFLKGQSHLACICKGAYEH